MPLDFGIEIECLLPFDPTVDAHVRHRHTANRLHEAFLAAGVPSNGFMGYTHSATNAWKIVTDASVSPGTGFFNRYVGLEIVSPPLTEFGFEQVNKVCRILQDSGAKTNKSCGLHVHIGARHLTPVSFKRLVKLFIENEAVIDGLLPPSRRGNLNNYCKSVKARTSMENLERAQDIASIHRAIAGGDRFVKLNMAAYWKYRTVEFRNHSGTIDQVKIIKWVTLVSKLVDLAVNPPLGATGAAVPLQDNFALQRRLRRVRKGAIIFHLACRPEGVTPLEAQQALNRRSQVRPAVDLMRLGVQWVVDGRRNGQKVYKIAMGATEPATLQVLLAKLGLTPEDQEFWHARAALFTGNGPSGPGQMGQSMPVDTDEDYAA